MTADWWAISSPQAFVKHKYVDKEVAWFPVPRRTIISRTLTSTLGPLTQLFCNDMFTCLSSGGETVLFFWHIIEAQKIHSSANEEMNRFYFINLGRTWLKTLEQA